MKRILILLIALFSIQLSYAIPSSIQRYAILGTNDDGTIIAVMLSHFGPSSQAPFATLIVKEAGNPTPIFSEYTSMLSGGEGELAQLSLALLNKNRAKLKNFGIKLTTKFIDEAHAVVSPTPTFNTTAGWIDLQNDTMTGFSIKSAHSNTCAANLPGIALTIQLDGKNRLTSIPVEGACWNDSYQLKNIYRTQKALWFFMDMHMYYFIGMDSYWIDVEGMTFDNLNKKQR